MTKLVMDVSVGVKWFLLGNEPYKDEAINLLRQAAIAEVKFLVPDLFWAEIGNVLWKAVRKRRCTRLKLSNPSRRPGAWACPPYRCRHSCSNKPSKLPIGAAAPFTTVSTSQPLFRNMQS